MATRGKLLATTFLIFGGLSLYGQVGIGTTTPETNLHIVDSLNTEVRVTAEYGAAFLRIDAATTPRLQLYSGGEEKATLSWQSNQFRLFSSPPDTLYILGNPVLIETPTMNLSEEKFVGIRMGLLGEPEEALHVNGRIKVGYSNEPATEGTIRYNTDTNAFEGYNGTIWLPFGGGGSFIDADLDTYIELSEASSDSIKFIANSDGIMAFDGHRLTLGKDGNTFVGHEVTPFDLSSNIGNTNIGWLSAKFMEDGVSNTNLGFWTGYNAYDGDWNTQIGAYAGFENKSGSSNTMLGYRAGYKNNGNANVFIGHRAGYNESGDNKLYIDNTDTGEPLIYGDFEDNQILINGEAAITGAFTVFNTSYLQGDVNVFGNEVVTGTTTASDFIVDGNSPYIDFKQSGTSKYFIQYDNANDRLDIAESGTGVVFRIKDGEVYLPELAGAEGNLKVDANGKLTKVVEPAFVSRADTYDFVHGEASPWVLDELSYTAMSSKLKDGSDLQSMTVSGQQAVAPPFSLDLDVQLWRRSKVDFTADLIFELAIPAGDLSGTISDFTTTTVETAGADIVDLDNYMYYLLTGQEQLLNLVVVELSE